MTASCCQADSGSAISHSKAKHLCAWFTGLFWGQAPVTAVTERPDMPICPLLSDFCTRYADIVAESWAQGPGRGHPSSQDQNPAGDWRLKCEIYCCTTSRTHRCITAADYA